MALVANARIVLTDSGGLQEETTVLGIPWLTLRENTERPVTVTHGTNRVIGALPSRMVSEAQRVFDTPLQAPVPASSVGWSGRRTYYKNFVGGDEKGLTSAAIPFLVK